jgi:tetratricopeptide (TPR) repeat protein
VDNKKGELRFALFHSDTSDYSDVASSAPQKLEQAQNLLRQDQLDQAEAIVAEILVDDPANIEARYTLAVTQRIRHEWPAALDTIDALLEHTPNFGRAYQEAGYNRIALKDFLQAGVAFERAVACDPSLVNSWKCLAKLYEDSGQSDQRLRAQDQVTFLSSLPAELLTVISYLSEDRLVDAERLCRYFLKSNKTHVEGMRLLAEIATRSNVFDEAEFLLESCVEFEPEHRNARIQYVNILLRTQKFHKAYDQAKLLLEKYPDDLETIKALYASACMGIGDNDAAIAAYGELIEASPDNYFYPLSLAHVYKSAGEFDKAVQLYKTSYAIKRDHGDAYWSLANTKSYEFSDSEIEQMQALEAAETTGEDDRVQICFALGKAFEDRQAYESSMQYYAKGNALKKAKTHHHEDQLQVRIDSQIEVCTTKLFESRQGLGLDVPDPIFIVGLPRAGSTLLEQILSSHSEVDGTMELHNILNLAKRLRGRDPDQAGKPRYPKILAELDDSYFRRFGEQFIEDTRAYRGEAPYFIDKMPNNFFHIGLIKLILPNAKIIDARRHPMACCFSGYKQLFGEGQEFSYNLRDIGNYYRQYVTLMDHWDNVLPGFVLRVQYEDVVADLETQVRRTLDFCELPFEQACVEFHKTRRSIRTPSAEQVRQPIYNSGLEQWRHFEPWLEPLHNALGPEVLDRYPAD